MPGFPLPLGRGIQAYTIIRALESRDKRYSPYVQIGHLAGLAIDKRSWISLPPTRKQLVFANRTPYHQSLGISLPLTRYYGWPAMRGCRLYSTPFAVLLGRLSGGVKPGARVMT